MNSAGMSTITVLLGTEIQFNKTSTHDSWVRGGYVEWQHTTCHTKLQRRTAIEL